MNNIMQRMIQVFGSMQTMKDKFNTFANNFQRMNQDPEQLVKDMLADGRMTQEQFDQCSSITNMLMGKKF